MNKHCTIMFHITISSIEDPELFELLHAVSGRDRAARARALMRQGICRQVAAESNSAIPPMSIGDQQEQPPQASPAREGRGVKEFYSFEFDIDQLLCNLDASRPTT